MIKAKLLQEMRESFTDLVKVQSKWYSFTDFQLSGHQLVNKQGNWDSDGGFSDCAFTRTRL